MAYHFSEDFYPDIPYEDMLISASIPSLSNYLNCICMTFVSDVASDPEHRLRKHLPKRQSSTGRHSTRLRDAPIVYNNYCVTKNSLFSKYSV